MSKTPISILQELMMQRKGSLPEYELLPSQGVGTHLPTFHYQVTVDHIVAEGKARSKKEAKHEAAKNALEQLCSFGIYHPAHVSTPPVASPSVSPVHVQVNAIGTLQDLCSENSIPQPEFQLKADIGPAHQRQFTYECKIATITTTATELTKKKAKQLTAQLMLHRLMDTLPEVIAELKVNEVPALQSAEHIIASYNEVSSMNKKRINYGLKISSYPYSIKSIMQEKNLTRDNLWQDITKQDEVDLQNILSKLDLKCALEVTDNEENTIVYISINTQPEFVIAEISEIKEEAVYGAIYNCFEFLKVMTDW